MHIYLIVPFVLQCIAWPFARILFWWSMHAQYNGHESVVKALQMQKEIHQKTGRWAGILFASNHESEFDPILIRAGFSFFTYASPMFYVSAPMKDFLEYDYGWRNIFYKRVGFFMAWGSYPLFPNAGDYAKSLRNHTELLEKGRPLTIFPEGGIRSKKREGHGGIGYLIEVCEPIVIPVRVEYTNLPSGLSSFLSRKATAKITYKQPLLKADFPHVDTDNIYQARATQVMNLIYT